ncbi:MAG: PAS domain S-box protein, partial [Pyrinomonadaceae bacterium]
MIKASSEKCRVLIVDNEQKLCARLTEIIEHEGYEVASAAAGGNALEIVLSFEPDVVISDVAMPLLEGLELCRLIKKDVRTADIPVILISSLRNAVEDSLQALTAGADDYLQAPFRNEELLVKVARLAERRRVEKHYREIVEDAADIIYTRDVDGYITSINAAGARFFEKRSEEIVGCHLSNLIGDEAAARDIEETGKAAADAPLRSTYHLKDAETNGKYLEGVITIERDRQGRATGIRGCIRDITEQKLAEAALRESEERYRELFENANDLVYTHDLAGRFTSLNRAGERITGFSRDEALKLDLSQVVASDYLQRAREMIRRK